MDAPSTNERGSKDEGKQKQAARPNSSSSKKKKKKKKKSSNLPPTTRGRTVLRALTGLPFMSEPNYLFYTGRLQSVPDGNWIDEIHLKWFWNYDLLESHHGYIQWLFPIFEGQGMNFRSYPLLKEEARKMRSSFQCNVRFLRSYKMMLNFYGLMIADYATGKLERTDGYKERFLNLNYCSHNNLRISRVLMALGEHGFVRYKRPLLAKLREEIKDNGEMPECTDSLDRFWTFLVEGEDTPQYLKKTKESPEDREEAVFFAHLDAQDGTHQKWIAKEEQWTEELALVHDKMRDKIEGGCARRMEEFELQLSALAQARADKSNVGHKKGDTRGKRPEHDHKKEKQQQQQQEEEEGKDGGNGKDKDGTKDEDGDGSNNKDKNGSNDKDKNGGCDDDDDEGKRRENVQIEIHHKSEKDQENGGSNQEEEDNHA